MSQVFLSKIKDTLTNALTNLVESAGITGICEDKSVLIKPNLFEPISHTTGQTTSPLLVETLIKWCQKEGAREVVVGEGPSYFVSGNRLKDCFTKTGIAEAVERCRAQWVLFDDCNYRTYRDFSPLLPKVFRISEHAFLYDLIINLPVPKTHYLTIVSIAMKNLKGFLKQEDKPLFHRVGLNEAVVELNTIIKPALNLVDFTIPRQHHQGFLLAGKDIVAVDSVSSALMGLTPHTIPMLKLGSQAGLGAVNLTDISIIGEDTRGLKVHYELPSEWLRRTFPLLTIKGHDTACSGCTIPLFSSLAQLADQGKTLKKPLTILLGRENLEGESSQTCIIGNCSPQKLKSGKNVKGCPPQASDILDALSDYV
jgi:uncharacterized protein (DUF362 family)